MSFLPDNPATGDQVVGPYEETYEWDGDRWSVIPDGSSGWFLRIRGGRLSGPLTLAGDAVAPLEPMPRRQLEAGYLPLTGGIIFAPGVSNPLEIAADYGMRAGIRFHEMMNRIWSMGTYGDGRFHISDDSASVWRLVINSVGLVDINGSISTGHRVTAASFSARNNVYAHGTDVHVGSWLYVGGIPIYNSANWLTTGSNWTQVAGNLQVNLTWNIPWGNLSAGVNITASNQLISGGYLIVQGGTLGFYHGDGWFGINQPTRVWDLISQNNCSVGGTSSLNVFTGNSGSVPSTLNMGNVYPHGHGNGAVGLDSWPYGGHSAFAFNNVSDPRLKDMLPTPNGALDKVNAIPVHRFTFTHPIIAKVPHTGFNADEVLKVFPDAVSIGKDEDRTQGIVLGDMIALLWQAVQELSEKL